MTRHRPRWTCADDRRMREWRACGTIMLIGVLLLAGLYVTLHGFRNGDHTHNAARHGGVIVSLEKGGSHYHVEAAVEEGHVLKLYVFGDELDQVQDVESQILLAQVSRNGNGKSIPVELMPIPRPSDPEGRTSQFFGKLPHELRGASLFVRIAGIEIGRRRFPLDFALPVSPHDEASHRRDQEQLYLTVGGKFTEADIAANNRHTASARYEPFRTEHNMKPNRGDRVCPITRVKTNREFRWVVSGKTYEFCCPPCIDQFMRRAKEEPAIVQEPHEYVKK